MELIAQQQFVELENTHWWFEGRRQIFFRVLESSLPDRKSLKVLDVGCGTGRMLVELARYGQVFGVDSESRMVRACHDRGFPTVSQAAAAELPYPDNTFDLVTFFDCLEHIEDDEGTIREARRVLKPGGILFVSVPAYQFLFSENDRLVHHRRRYRLPVLKRIMRRENLAVDRASYFNLLLFPIIVPVVLFSKLRERTLGPRNRTNLSFLPPPLLNRTLAAVFSSEKYLVTRLSLPIGHSIYLMARKPEA